MMNNKANCDQACVPSMMPSFVGLEGSSQKQHRLRDWETNSHYSNTTTTTSAAIVNSLQNHPLFPSTAFLDCSQPLVPMNSFPFYLPPYLPEYHPEIIRREDGIGGSGRIGLNLGHRTYFSSADALTIDRLFARSRGVYSLSHQPPRCQAEGCKADLSGAKHYHRRHKVCEFHSKASVVIAGGLQQRFCQQCSRFHVLSEFDESKRSCRKRLADHNRRRRKPHLTSTTTRSSASMRNTTNNCAGKGEQAPELSRDITTSSKSTITSSTNIPSTNISLKGQQSCQDKANQLRNGPALSLGGVGVVEDGGLVFNSIYQSHGPFAAMTEDKEPQQQLHSLSSASTSNSMSFFQHHNLFSSNVNETSQSTGGGSARAPSSSRATYYTLGKPCLR